MPTERLLRIEAPHFVAGALYAKDDSGRWRCTLAAPIVAYLWRLSPAEAKAYLDRKRWRYEWLTEG
jgi:hypothetical protein